MARPPNSSLDAVEVLDPAQQQGAISRAGEDQQRSWSREAEEYRRDVTVLRAKHIDVVGWMLTAWSRMEQGERWLLTRIVPCDVLNADLAGARAF